MSTRAHANICLGMKQSTRTKPEGDSEGSNVETSNREDWKKCFRRGRAGSGDGRDVVQVRAAAEFLDQLNEALKRAGGQRAMERVGTKMPPENGARSPFLDAHCDFCSEVCR
ncbi:hypothetical protein E5288_WYG014909 [Bos mutus]|uniref:Uncharacterized protein n=1 Tax=Bos mutus TaxID=72004 RepID=A0A6B0S337_9CETA|nr:hypothetical protein [Bos mutus]